MDDPGAVTPPVESYVPFQPVNPLVVREKLGQPGNRADLRPGQRAIGLAQRPYDRLLEGVVGHHALLRPVPIRASALRADAGLFVTAAARDPLVAATFAPEPHDGDRNSGHRLSTRLLNGHIPVCGLPGNGVLTNNIGTIISLAKEIALPQERWSAERASIMNVLPRERQVAIARPSQRDVKFQAEIISPRISHLTSTAADDRQQFC
jgi:hypothetical protein